MPDGVSSVPPAQPTSAGPSDAEIKRKESQAKKDAEAAQKLKMAAMAAEATGIGAIGGMAIGAGAASKEKKAEKERQDVERMKQERASVPSYAPYSAPAQNVMAGKLKTPIVVAVAGLFLYWFLSFSNQGALAKWVLVTTIFYIAIAVIFKEPKKALIVLILPVGIFFLQQLNMLTPAWAIGLIGFTAVLMLLTFDVAREHMEHGLQIGAFLGLGILIFWTSAWAQMGFKIPYPHIITTTLILAYWVGIVFSKSKLKWIAIPINVLFFMVLFMAPTVFAPSNSPFGEAVESQRQAWISMFTGVQMLGTEIGRGFERQYLIATGDYEEGVQANSEKPLGVFLENVGISSGVVEMTPDLDEKVNVYARLRSESFKTDKDLKVAVRCYPEGFEDDVDSQGIIRPGGNKLQVFSVVEYESQDIDCIIDADELGVGSFQIALEATFDFETSAFLKSYFMDQDRKRALDRELQPQNKVALDAFGITDKNPLAVFTAGPIKVGMGAGQQPVALVVGESDSSDYGPTLRLTLDRNWFEGELTDINSLTVTVPPGIKILDIDGLPVANCLDESSGEQTCSIEGEEAKRIYYKPLILPKTISVHTRIDSNSKILAGTPLAIRSFKANIDYKYRVKKSVGVTIRERPVPKAPPKVTV